MVRARQTSSTSPTGGGVVREGQYRQHTFIARESILTAPWKHPDVFGGGVYLWLATLLPWMILFGNVCMMSWNFLETGEWVDPTVFVALWGDFPMGFLIYLGIVGFSFLTVFLLLALRDGLLPASVGELLYTVVQWGLYIVPCRIIIQRQMPFATAMGVAINTLAFSMKLHSYWRTHRRAEQDRVEKELPGPAYEHVSLWGFYDFLRMPTLVYSPVYPRTRHIRWGFVVRMLAEFFSTTLLMYLILMRFMLPVFPTVNESVVVFVVGVFKLMAPGVWFFCLLFYGVSHCCFNFLAEVTWFADRQFYLDWWNVSSFDEYYRRWNSTTYNWLHKHIYASSMRAGHLNKNAAVWATFVWSALLHEFALIVMLKMAAPWLMVMFVGPGVAMVYVTRHFTTHSTLGKAVFWLCMCLGDGMLLALYAASYHSYGPAAAAPSVPE